MSSRSPLFSLRVAMTQTCRKVRPATSARVFCFMSGWQTQRDRGRAKLVMGPWGSGAAGQRQRNLTDVCVECFLFSHEALCCGLFRSPCHGKCSAGDGTTQTARLQLPHGHPLYLDPSQRAETQKCGVEIWPIHYRMFIPDPILYVTR